MVSLPAGVRGPGEVTLPFPHPPVKGDNYSRMLSSLWSSMQRPKDCAMSYLPHPALDADWSAEETDSLHPSEGSLQCLQAWEAAGWERPVSQSPVL